MGSWSNIQMLQSLYTFGLNTSIPLPIHTHYNYGVGLSTKDKLTAGYYFVSAIQTKDVFVWYV